MELYPLTNKEDIAEVWPYLIEGFKETLKYSNGDDSLATILNDSLNGFLTIFIGIEDNKIIGFVTIRLREYPIKRLIIDHAWQSKDIKPFTYTKNVLNKIENYAKSLGCVDIRTYSLRNVEKYYQRFGFKPSYREYKKELIYDEKNL